MLTLDPGSPPKTEYLFLSLNSHPDVRATFGVGAAPELLPDHPTGNIEPIMHHWYSE